MDTAADCVHLSVLHVKEVDNAEYYSLGQHIIKPIPSKKKKKSGTKILPTEVSDPKKLYSEGLDLALRREIGLFNLCESIGKPKSTV